MDLTTSLRILSLDRCASPEDVKRTFYAQAHRLHPDKNPAPNAADDFRRLVEAYQYCLTHWEELAAHFGVRDPEKSEAAAKKLVVENLDDIFLDILGAPTEPWGWGYVEPETIVLTLQELLEGGEKNARLQIRQRCTECHGRGTPDAAPPKVCRRCFGKGLVASKPCVSCSGRGRKIHHACLRCLGLGHIGSRRKVQFQIPRGATSGTSVFLDVRDISSGNLSRLTVRVEVKNRGIFQIDHYDLLCDYFLNFSRHKTEGLFKIKMPHGERPLVIPKTARPGDVVTLKGEGLFKDAIGKSRGDLRVVLREKKPGFWRRMNRLIRRES